MGDLLWPAPSVRLGQEQMRLGHSGWQLRQFRMAALVMLVSAETTDSLVVDPHRRCLGSGAGSHCCCGFCWASRFLIAIPQSLPWQC